MSTTELTLQQQLMEALGLTETDFHKDGSNLCIRADKRVMPWLKANYQWWTTVQGFAPRGLRPIDGFSEWLERWPEGYLSVPHQ